MFVLRGFFILLIGLYMLPASAQTNPAVVTVDSTLRNPNAKKDPAFTPKKDTTANLKVKGSTKPAVVKDSARLALERMPKQAARRSAIIPGWGQLTNKQWWKLPFVYGGFVGVGLIIDFNQRYYKKSLKELQHRYYYQQKSDPELMQIDDQGLIQYKDFYRRNRDFGVLLGVGMYTINIIDAYVTAKFFRFDISDELGLKIGPSVVPSVSHAYAPVPVLKFQLSL